MSSLSATFTNYSKATWELQVWHHFGTGIFGGVETAPGKKLEAMDGLQTFILTFDMSALANGMGAQAIWWTGASGNSVCFGVKLVATAQVFGVGPRPHWEVLTGCLDDQAWKKSGSVPGDQYTWTGLPYKIVGTPTSSHESLKVDIVIND